MAVNPLDGRAERKITTEAGASKQPSSHKPTLLADTERGRLANPCTGSGRDAPHYVCSVVQGSQLASEWSDINCQNSARPLLCSRK